MTTTTTSPTPSTTATQAVDRFLAGVEAGAVPAALYAPGAHLDAVVPGWRLGADGPAAIADEYGRWFAHPGTLDEVRRQPTATGEVVEYTVAWTEDGVPHAARHVHVIDVGPDGITRDEVWEVWCGGRWPAELLAQIEAARDAG